MADAKASPQPGSASNILIPRANPAQRPFQPWVRFWINRPTQGYYSRQTSIASQFYLGARGLNWEQSAKVFSRCSMKMRTLAEIRRLAGRTATIGTVRSKGVNRRRTVPSRSSAANSHAGACAIPRCSRTPILICSISLVLKTPVGIIRFAFCPDPILHGWADPRSTKTTAGKRRVLSAKLRDGAGQRVILEKIALRDPVMPVPDGLIG